EGGSMANAADGQPSPTFGNLLRRYRAAAELTQEELAERAGVSARTIGDVERGVSRAPHQATVGLLAEALGLTGGDRTTFEASARRRAVRAAARTPPPTQPAAGMLSHAMGPPA